MPVHGPGEEEARGERRPVSEAHHTPLLPREGHRDSCKLGGRERGRMSEYSVLH